MRACILVGLGIAQAGCRFDFDSIAAGDGPADRYGAAVLADGPVAYWRFGESSGTVAHDYLGGHPATYQGQCKLGVPGAIAGDTAVELDGTSCRIDVGDAFAFGGGAAFTMELWADIEIADATSRFLVSRDTPGGISNGYQLPFQATALWFERLDNAGGDGYVNAGPPTVHQFEMIAITYDGTVQRFYRDGTEITSATVTMPEAAAPGALAFGDTARQVSAKFAGVLDEIAFYDKALPPARVAAHFAAR